MSASFESIQALAALIPAYRQVRAQYPTAPARQALAFVRYEMDGGGLERGFEQFICKHRFECSGTAYGGDDERWHGEGRCLCIYCGLDGDA